MRIRVPQLHINILNLFAAIYFITFFEPMYISFTVVHIYFVGCRIIASLIIIVMLILGKLAITREEKTVLKGSTFIPIMYLAVSIFNGSFYFTYAINLMTNITFFFFTVWFLKRQGKSAYDLFRDILISYLIINFLLYFIFPDGLIKEFTGNRRVWLLGTKNSASQYYILLSILFMAAKEKKDLIRKTLFFLVMLVYMLVFNCATGIVCASVGIMLLLIPKLIGKKQVLDTMLLVGILITIGYFMGFLAPFVEWMASLVDRGPTLSGRFAIWGTALTRIKEFPLLGQGNDLEFVPWSNTENIVNTAHNFILDIASRYGIIATLIVSGFLIKSLIFVYSCKCRQSYQLFAGMILLIILGIVEAINTNILLSVIIIPQIICMNSLNLHDG